MSTSNINPLDMAPASSKAKDKLDSNVVMHRNITKLESSDFYKKLTPAKKVAAQTQFYNKYVTPVHKELNYKGSLQEWLKDVQVNLLLVEKLVLLRRCSGL